VDEVVVLGINGADRRQRWLGLQKHKFLKQNVDYIKGVLLVFFDVLNMR